MSLWAPDGRDGGGVGRVTRLGQAVHLLESGQHAVVVDLLVVGARLHVRAVDDGGDLVAAALPGAVVLVPRDDQQAVVGHGPVGVVGQVAVQPGVARRDRSVVHVVV